MSFGNCDPACETELESIPRSQCAFNLGQIIRIGVRRVDLEGDPAFPGLAEIQDVEQWQARLDADDDSKIVITPIIEGLTIPASTAILEGGDDNSTLDGMPISVGGSSPRSETGMIRSIEAAIRVALKKIQCHQTLDRPLEVFFFNNAGRIIANLHTDNAGYAGIPVGAFFVGDPAIEGLNTDDKTPIGFSLAYGWADRLRSIAPDFNVRQLFATES